MWAIIAPLNTGWHVRSHWTLMVSREYRVRLWILERDRRAMDIETVGIGRHGAVFQDDLIRLDAADTAQAHDFLDAPKLVEFGAGDRCTAEQGRLDAVVKPQPMAASAQSGKQISRRVGLRHRLDLVGQVVQA